MDKRQLCDEVLSLLTPLGQVMPDDDLLAKVQAKVEAMESDDGSARLWLIAKLIVVAKSRAQSVTTGDRLKVGEALDLALTLTGQGEL